MSFDFRFLGSFRPLALFFLCASVFFFNTLTLSCHQELVKKSGPKYSPSWESLDKRPAPEWYDNDKIGVFMHFGVYSVPAFMSEWFWYYHNRNEPKYVNYMKNNYPGNFKYQDFASLFKCPNFDANAIAELVKSSGARYFIITSKHHEGYTLWPSATSWNWNSVDTGPNIDIIDALSKAIKKQGIKFCVYISLLDWFHPDFIYDSGNSFNTTKYVDNVLTKQLHELVNNYKPDCIWSDGDWASDSNYYRSKEFLAWLFSDSPVKEYVVVNDRWGWDSNCKHGTFRNCEDKYEPGKLLPFKWESAFSVDKRSWGHRKNMSLKEIMTTEEIIGTLIRTNSFGGNSAVNVGPSSDGSIEAIFSERLTQMGDWLRTNGESIYNSTPFRVQRDGTSNIYYSSSKSFPRVLYASFLGWPANNQIVLTAPKTRSQANSTVRLLGCSQPLKFTYNTNTTVVDLPNQHSNVDVANAWVLRFDGFN